MWQSHRNHADGFRGHSAWGTAPSVMVHCAVPAPACIAAAPPGFEAGTPRLGSGGGMLTDTLFHMKFLVRIAVAR